MKLRDLKVALELADSRHGDLEVFMDLDVGDDVVPVVRVEVVPRRVPGLPVEGPVVLITGG